MARKISRTDARLTHIEVFESRVLLSSASFASPVTTQIAEGIFPVVSSATGDLNGDGIPDLVVDRDNLQAQVYLGTATGVFTPSQFYVSGGDVIALGDFLNNGNLDLATLDGLYQGDGDGIFGSIIGKLAIPQNTVSMYAQDVNADGNLDLVCVTYTAGTGTGTSSNPTIGISVLLGEGNGQFLGVVNTTVGSAPNLTQADATAVFGDFNNDGNLDIVTPLGLMLGNGDGTFQKAIPLPFSSVNPSSTNAVIPTSPLFAVGDFNGDGNLDLATIPATGNSGNAELFLGTGKGTFSDAGPITVGLGETITSLTAASLTSSGNTDLIAGVSSGPGVQTSSSDVAVMLNSGTGTFGPAALFPVSGPPENITAEDFNNDGNLDLLSIDGVPGTTTSSGLPLASSASVLINSQIPLTTPVLTLHTSSNPAVAGQTVKYTAVVQPPPNSTTTAVPTGTITFYNGTGELGSASLSNGKATLTTTVGGVGAQSITFIYGGDSNYAGGTSAALTQTVLATGAKVPLLIPSLNPAITIPAEFIAGDRGNAIVTLTNGGGAAAAGRVNIDFYLSESGAIDSSAIAVAASGAQNYPVEINSGKSVNITAHLKLGSYAPGNYFLVAQVMAAGKLISSDVSSSPVLSTTTFQAAGLVFGTVGIHHGIVLNVADSAGVVGALSITGSGLGTITQSNGTTNLTVTGTSTTSHVMISSTGPFTLNDVDVQSPLNTFAARTTTIAGTLNFRDGVRQLTLGSASAATGAAVINIGGGTFLPTISLEQVGDAQLTSAGEIASIAATSWQAGAIDAPAIDSLTIAGSFGADIRVHAGGKLKLARIGAISGGTWAVAGGIGTLHVIGGIAGASMYAGADTGRDNVLGTSDDSFAAASIGVLSIGGNVTGTLIAAGVTPLPDDTILTGLSLLPKGSIGVITLRGTVDGTSRFLATHLPKTVTLNGSKVSTATDQHFQV